MSPSSMAMLWPYLATVALLAALGWFAWRRPSVPGARPLAIACLFSALLEGGSAGALAAADPSAKLAWYKFLAVWAVPGATAALCFALEYVQPGRWLTRRNLMLLAIPSVVALTLILTNDLHHWILRAFEAGEPVAPLPGPAWWPMYGFALGMYLVNLAAFVWLFARSPRHRGPVALMIAGGIAGRVATVVGLGGEPMTLRLDLPALTLLIPSCCYIVALFGFRILDPLPAAVQSAIDQMREGMVVFGPGWQVLGLNPAAEQILGVPASRARGRSWPELLPGFPDLRARLAEARAAPRQVSTVQAEATPAPGPGARHYALDLSALLDFRGPVMGYLLLLHDVTEQTRAQTRIVEQQRALAMLHERESLARELHDGIGQVLGFASLKAGATRKLIADGKLAKADDQLAQVESITADAHADVREYILNLRTAPTEQRPFFAALEHYAAGFRQNYDIQVELSVGAGVDDDLLSPEAQAQLFRIVQEAFSNVRKHAATGRVRLSFERQEGLVRICIQDDGQGFDPQHAAGAEASHFGLRFMRERAEQIGGRLEVSSQPGRGTQVVVDLPVNRSPDESIGRR